jgi:hypothetical protein
MLGMIIPNIYSQENDTKNWFQKNFTQRIYLGINVSFGDEKAIVLQAGYDAVLNLINITPEWHLSEFSLGLDVLAVRDQISKETPDNFGHIRSTDNRFIPGLELNWGGRLYSPPIPNIKTSIYLEAVPITFVYYAKPYPDSGTNINIGTHFGLGFKYQVNEKLDGFTTLRFFSHTSNGQAEETNPAWDAVGIIMGIQF